MKSSSNTSVKKRNFNIFCTLTKRHLKMIFANKIRMFYRGKEMKNGNELWAYNIEDDCVVQVMCSG